MDWGCIVIKHHFQKFYTSDFLTKKQKKNNGEIPQYYVENNHEAIIEPSVFDAVQREIEKRGPCLRGHHYSGVHIFSGKIHCGECGGIYGSKVWHSNSKYRRNIWQCNNKFDGDKKCSTPHLYDEDIKKMFLIAVNKLLTEKKEIISAFEIAKDTTFDLSTLEAEQIKLRNSLEVLSNLIQRCIRENANTALDQTEYQSKYNNLIERFDVVRTQLDEVTRKINDKLNRKKGIEEFLDQLKSQSDLVTEFEPFIWASLVDYVTVYSKDDIRFTFKDGTEIQTKE